MRALEEEINVLPDGLPEELPEQDADDPHPLPAEIIDLENLIPR
jgi:hypothetical protein